MKGKTLREKKRRAQASFNLQSILGRLIRISNAITLLKSVVFHGNKSGR
jgi:hypothetical protein